VVTINGLFFLQETRPPRKYKSLDLEAEQSDSQKHAGVQYMECFRVPGFLLSIVIFCGEYLICTMVRSS
jgi:hypothetical protein